MLRNDGEYCIWIVQFKYQQHETARVEWSNASNFIERLSADIGKMKRSDRTKYKQMIESFGACGKCWQQTGVHGCFSEQDAAAVMIMCARYFPQDEFRLACVDITQKTTTVLTASKTNNVATIVMEAPVGAGKSGTPSKRSRRMVKG